MRNIVKKLDAPSESETRQSRQPTLCPASRHALRDTPKNPVTLADGNSVRPAEAAVPRTTILNCETGSAAHQRTAPASVVRASGNAAPASGRRGLIQTADPNRFSPAHRASLWSSLLAALIFLTLVASQTASAIDPSVNHPPQFVGVPPIIA